jgi:type I restriction-modification system DNA methylase subunit
MVRKRQRKTLSESRARYFVREQAKKRGWNTSHLTTGGDFLEENEIIAHFPDIGLMLDRPDFLICLTGNPTIIVETKNEATKVAQATLEARAYAEQISSTGKYDIRIAVGIGGSEEAGFSVEVSYLSSTGWVFLKSNGIELTALPTKQEVELALTSNTGTTKVSIPESHDFIDAAIDLSILLRLAKVEAPLRPKVIGAIVLALYQGQINTQPDKALETINTLAHEAITQTRDLADNKKAKLIDTLKLSGADFDRVASYISRAVAILKRLNIRSVLHTDTDFLGMFYEAFIRYGYDNNALGIVFTPRHITRFCVELVGCSPSDRVIDIASGTGGFLVAAFDAMMSKAKSQAQIEKIKSSLYGFDTNPTVWSLASLNMFFRGDGKSHIELGSSLDLVNRQAVKSKYSRAFLNPPFSQGNEPERDFVDAAMDALEPDGLLAAVVAAGIFADDDNSSWRREFLRRHTLLGMISLPEDLFYPTSAPTSIILAKAHIPQDNNDKVFMARVWNDGYEKLKGRRVNVAGSQLQEIQKDFQNFSQGQPTISELVTTVTGELVKNGAEWSPQQYLPQPHVTKNSLAQEQENVIRSIYRTTTQFPELAEEALKDFTKVWSNLPSLPLNKKMSISSFFEVLNGKSSGEKNYTDGTIPYVSSGDSTNSIVRLVSEVEGEVFQDGGISVTAFGMAALQPWRFMARGNGGSAVRVLIPKFNMSLRELVWFAAQINAQRWRFFYARMSIASRLRRLEIESPITRLPDSVDLTENLQTFRKTLDSLSKIS